ncbi:nucleotide-diphospho-sugar transferase [Gorgonomyces haynaldii]|nr:nucleotide-diphospho-sugar transferase [Gorgonomyces haynaldii]
MQLSKRVRRQIVLLVLLGLLYFFYASTRFRRQQKPKIIAPPPPPGEERANAVYVVFCRNSDLNGMVSSMQQLEASFNARYNYPYVFLNDVPFTDEFKQAMQKNTNASVKFGVLDRKKMWDEPQWIDKLKAAEQRIELGKLIAGKGTSYWFSVSYRQMCRFYSGWFFRHPLLQGYEFYWRVEPDVKFYCQIRRDPFMFMKKNNKVYGYNIMMPEYMPTIASLWNHTVSWAKKRPDPSKVNPLVRYDPDTPLLNFFTEDRNGVSDGSFNGCHFWSNFEIARLDLWNNPDYISYFDYLDKTGGFFYERWGDAPVHSLYVAITLSPDRVHFFDDIGYSHDGVMHCPLNEHLQNYCECSKDDIDTKDACLAPFQNYKPKSYGGFPKPA